MKIILEFKTKFEHDKYCVDQTRLLERETVNGVSMIKNGIPINDYSKRRGWSELEMQFVKDNYMSKKITWIAKQLRKKPTQLYSKMTELYANGLPRKFARSGEVNESD